MSAFNKALISIRAAAVVGLFAACLPACAQERGKTGGDIVIGQSLPVTGPLFEVAQAVQSGAKAQFERINRAGGINGRAIRLVTLDDRGDPAVHGENVKQLVREMGAVAVINCVGDASCRVGAAQAEQMGVPLIGALSGSRDLRQSAQRQVFNIRAGYDRESAALAHQLAVQGVQRVALVGDEPDSEALATMAQALRARNIASTRLSLPDATDSSLQSLQAQVQAGRFDAAVVQLSQHTMNRMESGKWNQRIEWPLLVMSFATPALTQTALAVQARIFGFSNVVPNPDRAALPLVRAFQEDMEQYGTAWGSSFEGLEAYVNAGACAAGIRAVKAGVNPQTLSAAMRALGSYSMGGFALQFAEGRPSASDWVDVGVLTRDRIFVR
jgi:ABC-type branched-subunit amino acid transport system substrate-binding protein